MMVMMMTMGQGLFFGLDFTFSGFFHDFNDSPRPFMIPYGFASFLFGFFCGVHRDSRCLVEHGGAASFGF